MSNLALLSSLKLPEFIREEYPAMVAFIEAYYRYVETLESVSDITDLDTVAAKYVSLYKETSARGFSDPEFLEVKRFVQSNKEFFSRKGTPDAFIFFFKAYFGETIEIETSNFLIASGGEISGDYFFYVTTQLGHMTVADILEITHLGSVYKVEISNLIQLDSNTNAVYFSPPREFINDIGDRCVVHDNEGFERFVGYIESTPSNISTYSPGKYWQVGKIIKFPSIIPDGTPTIARVKSITPNSGIGSIEIIEYGFPHADQQTFIVSPFNFQPITSVTYTEIVTQYLPSIIKTHTLVINDTVSSLEENIYGLMLSATQGYFLEDYTALDYNGLGVIAQINQFNKPLETVISDVSLETWTESRATLKMNFTQLSRERQQYISNKSLLSDQNTKLHDSYYYQQHAYLLKTSRNIEEYRGSIGLLHPAGLKLFAQLEKIFDYSIRSGIEFTRVFNRESIAPREDPLALDTIAIDLAKSNTDTISENDFTFNLFSKILEDTISPTDIAILTSIFNKRFDDSSIVDDYKYITAEKIISADIVTPGDRIPGPPVYNGYGVLTYQDQAVLYWNTALAINL